MSVVLSKDLELQVQQKVTSGSSSSEEEVLRAAFRLLNGHESWESDGIGEGLPQADSHVSM